MRPLAGRATRQRGLGLVEVLVAMAIGLVLLGAVGYLFVGSKQMNTTQSDLLRMQESARNAMDVMGRALRQAGYRLNVNRPLYDDALGGLDGGDGADGAPLPDTLVVRHDPAWSVDAAGLNPLLGHENDCEGEPVTSDNLPDPVTGAVPANPNLVQYSFSVIDAKLVCHADPAAGLEGGAVVAENIENMQLTYGIGDGNELITKYTATPSALELTRVAAVRVSLLVRGPSPHQAIGGQSLAYNGATLVKNDGYLRRVYTSTFTVRNQMRWK